MRHAGAPVLLATLATLAACSSMHGAPLTAPCSAGLGPSARPAGPDASLEPNWKERIAQPYLFIEKRGDYRGLGDTMRRLLAEAHAAEVAPAGPPFALYYDDPGRVPVEELRARVCLPVNDRTGGVGSLGYDVLPRAMVVYSRVRGAYPEVAKSYPALFTYLDELGWRQGGPVREIYLVDPASVASFEDLLTEVQIPWTRAQ